MRYLFDICALDVERRELQRGTLPVAVTPQVFDLLEYLIRNRAQVVSRDDLIEAIWKGRIVSEAALTTRINAVRSAIGDSGGEQRLIRTLPRKGFRFVGAVTEMPDAKAHATVPSEEPAPALPDRPSIAVLPFETKADDAEQEHFADGLVDDIVTALSRFRALFVIARQSSFTYKGKAADPRQVGRELGVRYVLEGSVRRAGARLRISAQLINAASGAHLWADRFEGPLDDMFDLQDRLVSQVVGAIAPELDRAEIERARRMSGGRIDAVTAHYRGLPHVHFPTTAENNEAALRDFRRALALDPAFAPALGGVSGCLGWRRANGWPGDRDAENAEHLQLAARLKALRSDDAFSLTTVGFNLFWCQLDFDTGLEMIEQALAANPNHAMGFNLRGLVRGWHGEAESALADLDHAMRLSPRDPFASSAMLGIALAHHNGGRHAEAAAWTDRALRALPPAHLVGRIQSIMVYAGAGRLTDARQLMVECLRQKPEMRRTTFAAPHYRSAALRDELLQAMIAAGLPE